MTPSDLGKIAQKKKPVQGTLGKRWNIKVDMSGDTFHYGHTILFQINNFTEWRPFWKSIWPCITLTFDLIISDLYFSTFSHVLYLIPLRLIPNMPCLTYVFWLTPIRLSGGHIGNQFDLVWPWRLVRLFQISILRHPFISYASYHCIWYQTCQVLLEFSRWPIFLLIFWRPSWIWWPRKKSAR